ncbi:MAG: hypothetical protein AAGA31_19880 [Bacteroidota bacterium]
MQRVFLLLFLSVLCTCGRAQTPLSYLDNDGNTHLVGKLSLVDLQAAPYAEWYAENASAIPTLTELPAWADELQDTKVKIFLGTWCGDSKRWVPRFTALWEKLGLNGDQLEFIGLYNGEEKYKQGPHGEESGYRIHRVPTFLFERKGKEIARIVERPRTDLLTDIAQIALGYPTTPQYPAANYLLELLAQEPLDSIQANLNTHFRAIRRNIGSVSELNTAGYVLLRAGKIDEALLLFRINAFVFPYTPNTLDSYAEAWLVKGEKATALELYEKVLKLTPEEERVAKKVAELRAVMEEN